LSEWAGKKIIKALRVAAFPTAKVSSPDMAYVSLIASFFVERNSASVVRRNGKFNVWSNLAIACYGVPIVLCALIS